MLYEYSKGEGWREQHTYPRLSQSFVGCRCTVPSSLVIVLAEEDNSLEILKRATLGVRFFLFTFFMSLNVRLFLYAWNAFSVTCSFTRLAAGSRFIFSSFGDARYFLKSHRF